MSVQQLLPRLHQDSLEQEQMPLFFTEEAHHSPQTIDIGCIQPQILALSETQMVCRGKNQTQIWNMEEASIRSLDFVHDDGSFCLIDGDFLIFHDVFGLGAAIFVWNSRINRQLWSASCYGQPPLLDGNCVISTTQNLYNTTQISLWDKMTGTRLLTISDPSIYAFSPIIVDGDHLIVGTEQGIKVWNKCDGQPIPRFADTERRYVNYLSCQNYEIICTYNNKIVILSLQNGTLLHSLYAGLGDKISSEPLIDDEVVIASFNDDRTIKGWNRKTGDLLFPLHLGGQPKVLDEGSVIINKKNILEIRDKHKGLLLHVLQKGQNEESLWADIAVHGQQIFCLLPNDNFRIWDKYNGALLSSSEHISSFRIERNRLFLSVDNGTIEVHDL
jgi:WD40 repeat protein